MRQIAIDGIDGAGKSTLLHGLTVHLDNYTVVKCPASHGIAGILRRLVLGKPVMPWDGEGICASLGIFKDKQAPCTHGELPGKEAGRWLFFAEMLHTYETEILPALEQGKTVQLDRSHFLSNIAYGLGQDIDLEYVLRVTECQEALVKPPDIALVLTVPYEESTRRLQKRASSGGENNHFDNADKEVFEKRMWGYRYAAKRWDWVKFIDADKPKEEVLAEALALLKN